MAPLLNVARWVARSSANGPGERFVVWLQGCPLRCPGCWNPDTWATSPTQLMSAASIASIALATDGIEGVTLSGGEPFLQAAALLPFVERIRAEGLSVVAFTGFELRELRAPAQRLLLSGVDLLIAGRYVQERRSVDLPLRGSANQTVHFLSPRYAPESVEGEVIAEVHLDGSGAAVVTGFPPDDLLAPA